MKLINFSLTKQNISTVSSIFNNKFLDHFCPVMSSLRVQEESDELYRMRLGHSLWSAISCQRRWLKDCRVDDIKTSRTSVAWKFLLDELENIRRRVEYSQKKETPGNDLGKELEQHSTWMNSQTGSPRRDSHHYFLPAKKYSQRGRNRRPCDR